ncbi:MAG: histone deacetylase [Desulfurivibrionaceae bacterium]
MPEQQRLIIVNHPACLAHDTGGSNHPETPERLTCILDHLRSSELADRIDIKEPCKAELSWLTIFHQENYLLRFEEAALSGKSFFDHPDNQICYDSYEAALFSAGAGPSGIDLLENGEDLVFCAVRPPGHHAEINASLGFCFLNNAVIAARYWQREYGRTRLAIIDWDAHHGNGIESAFEEDPDVLYVSLHEHPTYSFPGTGFAEDRGSGAGRGTTLNIPLLPGSDDRRALKAAADRIEPALAEFSPERLIIAAGFDGHVDDDMSGLAYSTDFYRMMGDFASDWGTRFAQGKVLTILEGGYHLPSLASGTVAYLDSLSSR